MRMKLWFLASCAIILSMAARPAVADTLVVQNASFENAFPFTGTCAGPEACAWNNGPIPDWTITGNAGSLLPSSTFLNLPLPDGSIVAYSNGGTISQTLTGTSLVSNAIYNLTVAVGQRLDGYPTDFSIAAFAGSTLLGELDGSNKNIPLGSFLDQTLSFSTGDTVAPGDLSIVLTSGSVQSEFDNVRFTESYFGTNGDGNGDPVATPEPGALGLTAAGLLCMGLFGWYTKRSSLATNAVQLS